MAQVLLCGCIGILPIDLNYAAVWIIIEFIEFIDLYLDTEFMK